MDILESVSSWLAEEREEILNNLFEFLRIPSVSAESRYTDDVREAGKFLVSYLSSELGARAKLISTERFPLVWAEVRASQPASRSVLIYGHYDVQPVEPLSLWENPPFEPVIKDGRIYARGASDDKGQLWILVQAVRYLVQSNQLPVNVYFLLEGEEETGSENIIRWLKDQGRNLPGEFVLVADTAIPAIDKPGITVSVRGIAYFQLDIYGPSRDLHSGVYGGAVLNPAHLLSSIVNSMLDIRTGKITIPGFYDQVELPSESLRTLLRSTEPSVSEWKEQTGTTPINEEGFTPHESRTIRPSLDVNGMWSGYTGEGSKTIIPASAHMKFSFRLVPRQDWRVIADMVREFLRKQIPETVRYELTVFHGGNPYRLDTSFWAYRLAEEAYERVFGVKPLPLFEGGSIPVVSEFHDSCGKEVLMMGFGLPSDKIHSPNESFTIELLWKGIKTVAVFLSMLGR